MKKRKMLKIVVATLFGGFLAAVGMVCGVNSYVKNTVSAYLMEPEDAANLSSVDCILVLGPSPYFAKNKLQTSNFKLTPSRV